MKKALILICLFYFSFETVAQVSIGRSVSPTNLYIRNIDDKYFDFLETTKTYFIVPSSLDFDTTKKIINDVWTYNDIEYISEEDYDELALMEKGNTIIRIHDTGYNMVRQGDGRPDRTVNSWFAYKFELISYYNVELNKKGKKNPDILKLADVIFTESMHNRFERHPDYSEKRAKGILDEPDFYNFNFGYIKNYFQILNKGLTERRTLDLEEKVVDTNKLKELKNQTLFVPKWILKRVAIFTSTLKGVYEPDELFKDYPFKYELLSYDELNSKILSGEEFYYLMKTQFNEHQIVSIINSKTGEIIYSAEKKSFNMSVKDLKALTKAIED